MLFSNLKLDDKKPIYLQIENYIENLILNGLLPQDSKLPSTRELSHILNVSRNTIVSTYDELRSKGLIYSLAGKGTFVNSQKVLKSKDWNVDWNKYENNYSITANNLDIIKTEPKWTPEMISFKSISPDGELFDVEGFKKSFLHVISLESHKLLNYGYAQGYLPLIQYLKKYMMEKGNVTTGKDILITNGFTEAFDLILSAFTKEGDKIICENPTHNTSIKIMKTHNLDILGVDIKENGLDFDMLSKKIEENINSIKFAYITPSYHNPTGRVMTPERRYEFYEILRENNIPIIEDGFVEELLYTSSHIFPISSLDNNNNGVIYIGSFSKILFPGMRIGWIYADKNVISKLESVKRCRNIHTSFLDQAILCDYLKNDSFEKYMKKIKKVYGNKFNFAYECVEKYIPYEYIFGDGGLYLFVKLKNIDTRKLLDECLKRNVMFMPGDLFFVNDNSNECDFNDDRKTTLRLAFSRLTMEQIEEGIKNIADIIRLITS
ncbi:MAG: PLP-dependent aminotransferase family protein [Clostridioides sp.]|nr:PLP-dependent aminotransferase family protein [Clostridioides sp.]